ncbi:MAG: chemotaxis protein CheA [Paenibacillaceae bacterium]|nr:MAG: chemotaxis protein CheA [Paenibacillaceae bacterium]
MDMNAYLSMFIDESNDHLQSLNENLLRLESSPEDLSIVQDIFRSAHTLKGMSATMGFEDLAHLTHEMENVLDLVRNGKLRMNSFIFDTLFKGLDALESMVQDIVGGGTGSADVSELVGVLKKIVSGEITADSEVAAASAAAAAPVQQAGDIELDQFQFSVLQQSIGSGHRVLKAVVTIREDCVLKSARAYMVFNVLEQAGEVVKSQPSVQDIEQEKFDRSFTVFLISQWTSDELKQQIGSVSEIESVEVTELDADALAALSRPSRPSEPERKTDKPQAGAAAGSAERKAPASGGAVAKTIRVDIERLDVLMNLFSELLIDRVRLEQLASEIRSNELTETVEHMSRISADLQNIVMKLRMVPVETVFNRFPRMVRDLAKSLDKKVDLIITGAETELDRTVIDEIGDPLVHLLRNSVDHGIEPVEKRLEAGKPETGTVHLRAFHSGNNVFIEIEDDGGGIRRDKVLATAVKRGIITEEQGKTMSDEEVYMLIFAPGFSTADKVSDISGRGVGLDVVKSKINALGGSVTVTSELGKGTVFSIQLPLTLSIISAMLLKLGSEKYAIPLSSIMETTVVKRSQIHNIHGNAMTEFRGAIIPVVSLAELIDSPDYDDSREEECEAVIIRKGDKWAAVLVDDFIGQSDIVLKPLGKYLSGYNVISGATILGDGQVALIIDPNALIK